MEQKSSHTIVAIVASLVIGMGGGYLIGMQKDSDHQDNMTKDNSSLRAEQADGVTVGGALMVSNLDIVDNAANASNVTTVVGLVQQAGLVETLKSVGPFTVFGPNNAAFEAVPADVLNTVASDNDLLTTVLTYHVVAGTYTTADLRALAASGESVKTVQGGELSFKVVDGKIFVVDAIGQEVEIETNDVISSNGVTHVIKNVLLPVDPSTL